MMWLLLLLLLLLRLLLLLMMKLMMPVIHPAEDDYLQTDGYHVNLSHHNRSTTADCIQNVKCTQNTLYRVTTVQTHADNPNFLVSPI
jgi:hypothetical protein